MNRATRVGWSPEERATLDALRTPEDVQAFLDGLEYNAEITCRSPRRVMRVRKAHCMEGALFAAAALHHQGRPPLLVDLCAVRDDDHIIAPFRAHGRLGAVAMSNYTCLRWRSPVYRTLRELVLSYFDVYYNLEAELTLRGYTRPLDLRTHRFGAWQTREDDLDEIGDHLDKLTIIRIVTDAEAARMRPVDARLYEAGLLGAKQEGLHHGG